MIKKVFRLYWDKDLEENWINEMVSKGWALSHFFLGMYTFESCEKNEYVYKIDLLDNIASTKTSRDYIKLVEETGAEFVTSWYRWVFFRKKSSEGEFELYTDLDSQIANYKKIRNMLGSVAIAEVLIALSQINFLSFGRGIHVIQIIGFMIILTLCYVLISATYKTNIKIKKLMKQQSIKE